MSAVAIKFKHGPVTFAAESAITGGQVVQAGTKPRAVVPATAGSATVLGVALIDAAPKSDTYTGKPEHTSVAMLGHQVPVTGDGNLAVGDVVIAAANGTVSKAAGTEPPAQIVGRVIEVLADNVVSIRLYV